MYFNLEDGHPDVPGLEPAISRREGVLLGIILHLLVVITILVLPELPFMKARAAAAAEEARQRQLLLEQQRQQQSRRFVFVQPRMDTPPARPPEPRAPLADLDRNAATERRAPNPTNPQPFSRGNTPDFIAPTPQQMARAAQEQQAAQAAEAARGNAEQDPGGFRLREEGNLPVPPTAPGPGQGARPTQSGALGEALRNLQRYAERAALENPNGGGVNTFGFQFDTKGVEFGPWIRRFIAQIKRNWFVPNAAMFLNGHVVITFNVHKDGALTDLTVVGPSGVESFNHAAYNALAASNPTYPLPPEYPSDRAFFTVTFYYNEPVPTP